MWVMPFWSSIKISRFFISWWWKSQFCPLTVNYSSLQIMLILYFSLILSMVSCDRYRFKKKTSCIQHVLSDIIYLNCCLVFIWIMTSVYFWKNHCRWNILTFPSKTYILAAVSETSELTWMLLEDIAVCFLSVVILLAIGINLFMELYGL